MKRSLLILIFLSLAIASNKDKIDPTGTYKLDSKLRKIGQETYGNGGEIRVNMLNDSTIVVGFYFQNGAPSYNMGFFYDTLEYRNSKAIYRCDDDDSTCALTLTFTKDAVVSNEKTQDYNWGCGFGHGVVANGYFRKVSSSMPIKLDPSEWFKK